MSLSDIGPLVTGLEGISTRAKSHLGEIVSVTYTQQAVDDYGIGVIWPVAENKYSDGHYDLINETKAIRVTTTDCIQWLETNA